MFRSNSPQKTSVDRLAVMGLSLLSGIALVITVWMLVDFLKEQAIVANLLKELPSGARGPAQILASDLRWQFRLLFLVGINVIVTTIAVIMLWRANVANQASLRDFKAFASEVLSGLDLGILTTDASGKITSLNQRALELLDVDNSYLGQQLEQIRQVPLKAFYEDWLTVRSPTMVRDFTMDQQGRLRKLRVFCQGLNDLSGNEIGHVLQVRDVTERVLIEERMRRMERYMGWGSLAMGLHHEIKNPLAALSLHVQLLEEQLMTEGTSEDNLQMLSVISTEVARIRGVLEGFRNFASLDSVLTTPLELADVLRRQIELMRPQAERQSVNIIFNSCEGATTIPGDQSRLEQAFLNLIINALEAMPTGGILTLSMHPVKDGLRIEVSDTGPGISENLAKQVLDPYFTTKSTGTGLGLAICDKVIRQHQGTLDFVSSKNGTTFEITLPTQLIRNQLTESMAEVREIHT
jgi:PAS domain S-box-containing protein